MKYSDTNPPLVCMMTQSTCYKGTRKFIPKGVLWHSTGANNPYLKRYVQPSDDDPNKIELLNLLGVNKNRNDWNHKYVNAGLNFWIGKLQDGTVAAVQTMPWDFRPWGCGSGKKGSLNDTHIQFEICEDNLKDQVYFEAIYKEACEVTAYLCKKFGLDPLGTIQYNGLTVPVIIDHVGSYKLGCGSGHSDVQHWFNKFGKNMDDIRRDVKAVLDGDTPEPTPEPTPTPEPFTPYKVRITTTVLNVRKGPGIEYPITTQIKDQGVYTIVEEDRSGKMPWGRLKSGAGWICLNYTRKV